MHQARDHYWGTVAANTTLDDDEVRVVRGKTPCSAFLRKIILEKQHQFHHPMGKMLTAWTMYDLFHDVSEEKPISEVMPIGDLTMRIHVVPGSVPGLRIADI